MSDLFYVPQVNNVGSTQRFAYSFIHLVANLIQYSLQLPMKGGVETKEKTSVEDRLQLSLMLMRTLKPDQARSHIVQKDLKPAFLKDMCSDTIAVKLLSRKLGKYLDAAFLDDCAKMAVDDAIRDQADDRTAKILNELG